MTNEEKFLELKQIFLSDEKELMYKYIENKKLIANEIFNKFLRRYMDKGIFDEEFVVVMYHLLEEFKCSEDVLKLNEKTNYNEFITHLSNLILSFFRKEKKTFRDSKPTDNALEYNDEINIEADVLEITEEGEGNLIKRKEEIINGYSNIDKTIARLILKEGLSPESICDEILNSKLLHKCRSIKTEIIENLKGVTEN